MKNASNKRDVCYSSPASWWTELLLLQLHNNFYLAAEVLLKSHYWWQIFSNSVQYTNPLELITN